MGVEVGVGEWGESWGWGGSFFRAFLRRHFSLRSGVRFTSTTVFMGLVVFPKASRFSGNFCFACSSSFLSYMSTSSTRPPIPFPMSAEWVKSRHTLSRHG